MNKTVRYLFILSLSSLALAACKVDKTDDSDSPQNGKTCATNPSATVNNLSTGSLLLSPCAIHNGRVKCWGENTYYQLGFGPANHRGDDPDEMGSCLPEVPINYTSSSVAVDTVVSSNGSGMCAILNSNRSVTCWGANGLGQLGMGDTNPHLASENQIVNLGTGRSAKYITAGNRHFCAILDNDKIKCWGAMTAYSYIATNPGFVGDDPSDMGDNLPYVTLPGGRSAKSISAGGSTTCAVLDDDSVYCWNRVCTPDSNNYVGPTFTCDDMKPGGGTPLGLIPVGAGVKSLAMGSSFICAHLTNNQVRCWGNNDDGILGQGDTIHRGYDQAHINDIQTIPTINFGTGNHATHLSAGSRHACAILQNGKLKCWGHGGNGALGYEDTNSRGDASNEMGDNLPYVDLGHNPHRISAGAIHTCSLLISGEVKCWGYGNEGRLGQGNNNSYGHAPGTMGNNLLPIPLW